MRACSTPMAEHSTSDAARMGEGSDPGAALLDRSLFRPYLEPDERILWVGRPGRIRWFFSRRDGDRTLWLIFLTPMTALMAWGIVNDIRAGDFAAISFPNLVLFGSFVFFFVLAVWLQCDSIRRERREVYALTDQHALLLRRDSKRPTAARESLATISGVYHRERSDGSGHITFGYDYRKGRIRYGRPVTFSTPRLTFIDIDHVSAVATLAETARAALLQRKAS